MITRAQLDNAQATDRAARAEVNAADAALTQAREAYGYTRILAPYAGVVTKRLVELGETVAPGTPLLSGFSRHLAGGGGVAPIRPDARS